MPQFIMPLGSDEGARAFSQLDEFTRSYVECAFWLLDEELEDEGLSFLDLDPESLALMVADCAAFQAARAELPEGYSLGQAGMDFWLTRNRHGAGFWDRGLGAVGDQLTKDAHGYGSCDLYLGDDGKLYLM